MGLDPSPPPLIETHQYLNIRHVRPSKEHYNVAASFDIGTYWSLLMDLHLFYALLSILQWYSRVSLDGCILNSLLSIDIDIYRSLLIHLFFMGVYFMGLFWLFYGSLLTISCDVYLSIHESPCRFWYCVVVCCSMLMYVIIQKDWGRVSFDTLLTLTNRTEGKGRE